MPTNEEKEIMASCQKIINLCDEIEAIWNTNVLVS